MAVPSSPQPSVSDAELLLNRKAQARLLAAKVDAVKRDGLPFYRPHPKQDKFHRSCAKRRAAFTANRWGKSTMMIAEVCAWLRNERPWYPATDVARRSGIPQHPNKVLVIVNDWDKVQEIYTGQDGKLWRFLAKNLIRPNGTHRNHSGAVDTIYLRNGSSLRFDTVKSFMSNPQGSESSDWDLVAVDEPCPEPMFKAQARGLIDRGGSAMFTLTALREPWITDAFEPDGMFNKTSPALIIDGDIYDNIYLTPADIEDFKATLTPDERECRLYGKPLHKAGLVYKEFQRDKHVLSTLPTGWRSFLEPPVDWSYYLYIDPHAHNPTMVLFLVVDPFGRKYYFTDLFEKCLIPELCAKVRLILGPRRLVRCRIDPIAFIEDPVDGTTWASEYLRGGLNVERSSKDLSRGILRGQEDLRADRHPLFSPLCKRTIWEFGRYHWDEQTSKPVDKDDHAMECFYRSVLDEPRYVEPQNSTQAVDDIVIGSPTRDELLGVDNLKDSEIYVAREHLMLN